MKGVIPVFFSFALAAILLVFTGCPDSDTTDSVTYYTLTYDGNGSDGGVVPAESTTYGAGVAVLGNTGVLTSAGKIFDGWNTAADGKGNWYWPGDTITMTSDTTLYAVWVTTTDRVFNAIRVTDNGWYTVTAKRLAVGKHAICNVSKKIGIFCMKNRNSEPAFLHSK